MNKSGKAGNRKARYAYITALAAVFVLGCATVKKAEQPLPNPRIVYRDLTRPWPVPAARTTDQQKQPDEAEPVPESPEAHRAPAHE